MSDPTRDTSAGCVGDEPVAPPTAGTWPDLAPGTPPLRSIYFYLTAGCNLRCGHCWFAPSYDRDGTGTVLSREHFRSALDQADRLGLSGFKFTGGEPTIHPRIGEMVAEARHRGKHLTIETNLTKLTPSLADEIAANQASGIFVSTSLDGADAATHDMLRRVEGTFDDTVRGIRLLVERGVRPQVIFSIQRENHHQVEPIIEFASELGAGSVKYNLVAPHVGLGKALASRGSTLTAEEFIALGHHVTRELQPRYPIFLHYSWPPVFQTLSELRSKPPAGCGLFNIIGLLADGTLAMCGIGRTVRDLVYGHLSRDTLADVWNRHPGLWEIRETIPHRLGGICSKCIFRKSCISYCAAANYNSDQGHSAPYWLCDHAEKLGLFPESRLMPGETLELLESAHG